MGAWEAAVSTDSYGVYYRLQVDVATATIIDVG